MKLIERIQKEKIVAFKEGNKLKTTLLGTLIGELNRNVTKDDSDDVVVKIIKKLIETGSNEEIDILQNYLPSVLTKEELSIIITDLISDNSYDGVKDMGKIMKYLTENYFGRYDGKVASDLCRLKLN